MTHTDHGRHLHPQFGDGWHRRALRGDAAARGALFDATSAPARAYAAALSGLDPAGLEAVLRAAYVQVAASLGTYDPRRAFGRPLAWVLVTVREEIQRRVPATRRPHQEVIALLLRLAAVERTLLDPEMPALVETLAVVAAAMATLAPGDAAVLRLFHRDGRTAAQIGASSGRAGTAVRTQLVRTRLRFREAVATLAGDLAEELRRREDGPR